MRVYLVFIFFFISYFTLFSKQKDTVGVIYEYNGESMTLFNDGTFVYKVTPCDICPSLCESDVVSFGRYVKYKNKAYYLFSSPLIAGPKLDVHVEENKTEENKINLKDSLKIELISPFEKNKANSGFERKSIFYQITVYYRVDSKGSLIDGQDYNDLDFVYAPPFSAKEIIWYEPTYTFWNHKFTIPKFENFTITGFKVKIYPTDYNRVHYHYLWFSYKLEDTNTNYIQINIPQFSYQYLCYETFFYKELRILNKDMVVLDNRILRKTGIGKKRKLKILKDWRYSLLNVKDPFAALK